MEKKDTEGKTNLFQMTKINFLDQRFEVGMKEMENKNTIRKKILFRKAEENIYKKCDFITKTVKKNNNNNICPNFDSLQLRGTKQ